MNVLTTPTEELKLRFPWPLTCKMACKALILGTDFDGAVEHGLRQGQVDHQAKLDFFKAIRSTNKSTAPVAK
jgi:hypothetical protein